MYHDGQPMNNLSQKGEQMAQIYLGIGFFLQNFSRTSTQEMTKINRNRVLVIATLTIGIFFTSNFNAIQHTLVIY